MLSRRTLIGKAAASAAAAVALGATRSSLAAIRAPRTAPTGSPTDDRVDAVPSIPTSTDASAVPPPVGEASVAPAAPPWDLVRPLTVGASIARGWRLAELGSVQHGACVVTLANSRGRSHRIHICRNDGTPRGLVYTRRLDLVVMNGGRSDLPTDEGFAQAVAQLAHVLAKNERRAAGVLAEFLPHTERMQRFAGAQLR